MASGPPDCGGSKMGIGFTSGRTNSPRHRSKASFCKLKSKSPPTADEISSVAKSSESSSSSKELDSFFSSRVTGFVDSLPLTKIASEYSEFRASLSVVPVCSKMGSGVQ